MKLTDKKFEVTLCEKCPAKGGRMTTAFLRGSSFRGRKIEQDDNPKVDHCFILVGEIAVADIMIANNDKASEEHDAEFIQAVFEDKVNGCTKPTSELTGHGMDTFCTPVNTAIDEFIKVNYGDN